MNLNFFKMLKRTCEREIKSREISAVDSIAFFTYRCTSRCNTCNIWTWAKGNGGRIDRELTPQKWTSIMDKLSRAGIGSLEIFGGDALLRKDATLASLRRCRELGIDTFFPTNSHLLDHNTAFDLVASGLGTIYFSVDGTDHLHNKIRGVSTSFARVRQAIQEIRRWKDELCLKMPRIGTITTVSRMNFHQLEEILECLKEFSLDFALMRPLVEVSKNEVESSCIDGIHPSPYFMPPGKATHLLTKEEASALRSTLSVLRRMRASYPFYLSLAHLESLPFSTLTEGIFPESRCLVSTTVVTLNPSGEVLACPYFKDYVLGSLVDSDSLYELWGNERHRRFLRKQRRGEFPVCRKCSMRLFYPGIGGALRQILYPYEGSRLSNGQR